MTEKLHSKLHQQSFDSRDAEWDWATFRDIVYAATLEVVGTTKRKHQDWLGENNESIQFMLDEKNRLHSAHLNDPLSAAKKVAFCNVKRSLQLELRRMQDKWLSENADEIQFYADRNDLKNFYSALKTVYGPCFVCIICSFQRILITDKEKAEHFSCVLNRPSTINEETIARLP